MNEETTRVSRMLEQLAEQTKSGLISWSHGSSKESFLAQFPSASVLIWSRDGDGVAPFVAQIISGDGQVISELESDWFGAIDDPDARPQPWNAILQRLFVAARMEAMNIGGTLDALEEDITLGRQPKAPDEDEAF